MFESSIIDKFSTWIVAQQWQKREEVLTVLQPLVIAISRQLGSGDTEITKQLGQELGWKVWDREIVDKIAMDAHVQQQIVEHLDEYALSAIEEFVSALFSATSMMTSQTYIRYLISTILSIGRSDKAIIVGRGANFILSHSLKVRIVAPLDYRIENLRRYHGISTDEAKRRIVHADQQRANFVRQVFGANIDDATLYDLMLKTDEVCIPDAVHIIRTAVNVKF